MNLRFITILLFCIMFTYAFSQPMPELSMFELNQTFYNPGSIGNQEVLTASFFYRANWVGMDGAPSTQVFCAHAPLRDPSVAVGVLVEHDGIGSKNCTGIHINYAYRLRLGINKLSLGLKGGIINMSTDYISFRDNAYDQAFDENYHTFYLPNFGVGILFYSRLYWAGISVPRLFGYESRSSGKYRMDHDFWRYQYFISGGGKIPVSASFSVEPSALVVCNSSYPSNSSFTLIGVAVYKKSYKAGIGYRLGEALILFMAYELNRQFSLGYSYDLNIGKVGDYSSGSHEININYKFGYRVNASNPREFE